MKLYFKNSYSTCKNFHREIESLKSIFKHNSYPHNLVNLCNTKFLNALFIQSDFNFMVPKRLRQTIQGSLTHCKMIVIFRCRGRLNTLFCLKDSLEKKIRPVVIYRYTCSNCK